MYSEHVGDIFTSTADVIGHGVNCRGVMGAGIAKVVRARMPEWYFEEYARLCLKYDMSGQYTLSFNERSDTVIANLFTQVAPGPNAEYRLLVAAMTAFIVDRPEHGASSIALPRIGCGIGGLDWKHVKPILQGFSRHINIEVWELEGVEW